MKKSKILIMLTMIVLAITLLTVTASAQTSAGWHGSDGNWSYYQDGAWVTDDVIQIGGLYYGFDEEGILYQGEEFWCAGWWRRAAKDGHLLVNSWYEDENGHWFYYEQEGKAAYDFTKIGNDWYYFYGDGRMASDEAVHSEQEEYYGYWAISESGTGSVKLSKAGWNQAFGKWYYMVDDGDNLYPWEGLLKQGSDWYYLPNNQLATNEIIWIWDSETETSFYAYADAEGRLLKNAWAKKGDKWVYADSDRQIAENGIYEIGGALYLFENGYLYDLAGERWYGEDDIYVTRNGGALKRNVWYYDNTTQNPGWNYYDNTGSRVKNDIRTIGGSVYYFDYEGFMQTNVVSDIGGAAYWFDSNGIGTKLQTGKWHLLDGNWYYVHPYGALAVDRQNIGGVYYCFDTDGRMVSDGWVDSYDMETDEYKYYLYGANGAQITQQGWQKLSGTWYYVDTDGSLRSGWVGDGTYYVDPVMYTNEVFEVDGRWYAANNDGVCAPLSGTGLMNAWGNVVYVGNNGIPLTGTWKNINGYWYYFGDFGYAFQGDVYEIGGVPYLFDWYGKMHTGGWLETGDGEFYYAGNDGVAYTGLKTINGVQYLFSDEGWLYGTGIYDYKDNWYVLKNGRVLCKMKNGWNQVGSDWYYLENDYPVSDELRTIGDITYGFDYEGRMVANSTYWFDDPEHGYQKYIFKADGAMVKGWYQHNGRWIYVDPESGEWYGSYSFGEFYIDGKMYFFGSDGYLQVGTFFGFDEIITTDANGVIISTTPIPDGQIIYENGYARLKKDGVDYSGWLGDYFFENGEMEFNTIIEYDGAYYAIGPNGKCRYNGWYKISNYYDEYVETIYAKADGTLACNEWLKLGKTYYYFEHYDMAFDGIYDIDGAYHEFAEDGKWLGEYKPPVNGNKFTGNGWKQIDGDWYYLTNGHRAYGLTYINGQWYSFEYASGKMVENGFHDEYYFGAGGAMAQYVGWKYLNGGWIFFNPDHTVQTGFVKSGNGYYYAAMDHKYDEQEDREIQLVYSLKNAYVERNGKLYYFDSTGYSNGALTGTGWYGSGNEWYYIKDGDLLSGYQNIGGKYYYFGFESLYTYIPYVMANSGVYYISDLEEYVLFGADGAQITKAGWHQIGSNWYYVDRNGFAYAEGIYMIQGSVYFFDYNGVWIAE